MKGGSNTRRWDGATALVAWLAFCISILSFLYYFRQGEILLYGDAVAHINIARRVFDSRTPGLLQLGTVWLPLPHLLMIPFPAFDMGLADRGGRIASFYGGFRPGHGRHFSSAARDDSSFLVGYLDQGRSLARRAYLRDKSEFDLPAKHSNDGAALSRVLHLVGGPP